jgi:hypothetical protein
MDELEAGSTLNWSLRRNTGQRTRHADSRLPRGVVVDDVEDEK